MGKVKVLTARQAADLIKDGDTVALSGFVANGIAEALNAAAEERFLETGHPRDLTLFWVAGTGNKDGSTQSRNHQPRWYRHICRSKKRRRTFKREDKRRYR